MSVKDSPVARVGKIDRAAFERAIASRTGAVRPEVLIGPRHGADCGIVDLGSGRVASVTCDPFFVMPELGWERAGWFAVHIIASDLSTSGFAPAYLSVDLNLPLDFPDGDLAELWQSVSNASREIGMAVVTGHTGRYEGCNFPIVGGGTAIGVGPPDRYVAASMARVGDAVLVTKGAAIETTGMFGATFPRHLRKVLGGDLAREAEDMFREMSVVRDARAAVSAGVRDQGVTSMHDATEGGVQGALVEIAQASGLGIAIDREATPVRPATAALCRFLDIDPFCASSEGTLVLTCVPGRTRNVASRLEADGIAAAVVGEMVPAGEGMSITEAGRTRELVAPPGDPFWPAYECALRTWDRT